MLDYARKKDEPYLVALSMWVDGDWSQTTLKKKLGHTTQETMAHEG